MEFTSYREFSAWPGWVELVVWGCLGATSLPFVFGWGTDSGIGSRVISIVAILGIGVVIRYIFGGLTALVQETRLLIYMGSIPLVKRSIPFADIVSIESVRYRPIAEFGGWGIRGVGKKKAWTARGNQAVVLTLPNDRLLYVGSDSPEKLEEHIRRAMTASSLPGE